jgi:hypothetical protein
MRLIAYGPFLVLLVLFLLLVGWASTAAAYTSIPLFLWATPALAMAAVDLQTHMRRRRRR